MSVAGVSSMVPGVGDVVASSNAHISGNVDVSGNVPCFSLHGNNVAKCPGTSKARHLCDQETCWAFAEIVKFLNVPERSAARYVKRPDFPGPLARLAAGLCGNRVDVDKWAKSTSHCEAVEPTDAHG